MLRKIFLLTLIVFVTACSSTNNVPLSVVSTATSISPTATVTSSPVPTATQIPPTATEAIDPATGWKMQIVDGEKQLFSPDVNAWVAPDGSSYLIKSAEESGVIPNAFQMQVFYLAEPSFVAPSINDPTVLTSTDGSNFTGIFLVKVDLRELGHMTRGGAYADASLLQSGKTLSITTPNGTFSFMITTDSKYRVYLMPPDKMPAGYQEWKSKGYRWIAKGDGTNAIAIMSISKPPTSKEEFMTFMTWPLAAMMTPNQSVGLYTPIIQAYPANFDDYTLPESLRSFQVSGFP